MSKGIPFILFNRFGISWPKVRSYFDALRCNEGKDLPLGAAGFCWGGKHVVNLAHGGLAENGSPLVDAVFTGHPSMLEIPSELEKVVKPLSVAIGDKDIILKPSELKKVKTALTSTEAKSEVVVYEGAGHGFCVRADPKNEKIMQQSAAAEDQALKWFRLHFAETKYESPVVHGQ
jgi:dienelactone hydrolase